MPQDWGNFFDQAPQTEAALPVAAMRAAVRPASGGAFGKSVAFPTPRPMMPTTLVQAPQSRPMELLPPPEMPKPLAQSNEWGDMAKSVAGIMNPEDEDKKKGDGFGDRMAAIDQQLQDMKAERDKALAEINARGKPATASGVGGAAAEGVFGNMIQQESGGTHFTKDGKIITSPAGALGIAQIMPGTAPIAAKLAGLPWDPELFNRGPTGDPAKDAEARDYNLKLGQAYYNDQLKTFGDPALAAAAYNAGPGAVAKALEQAKQTGRSYMEFLPAETQNYVRVVTRTKDQEKAEGGRIRYLRSLVGA